MEVKDARKYAGWYSSYMNDKQGVALINCLSSRIKSDDELFKTLIGEIELSEDPKEHDYKLILQSVKALIERRGEVESQAGYFKWIA